MSDAAQQAIFDAEFAHATKGRRGLGYDGAKKRAKVVEIVDDVLEVVKAVITDPGYAGDDADGYDDAAGTDEFAAADADDAVASGRVEYKSHSERMHPRNRYRLARPDFAALAAKYPSFAPLYVQKCCVCDNVDSPICGVCCTLHASIEQLLARALGFIGSYRSYVT